jgi:hypothetical protein
MAVAITIARNAHDLVHVCVGVVSHPDIYCVVQMDDLNSDVPAVRIEYAAKVRHALTVSDTAVPPRHTTHDPRDHTHDSRLACVRLGQSFPPRSPFCWTTTSASSSSPSVRVHSSCCDCWWYIDRVDVVCDCHIIQ